MYDMTEEAGPQLIARLDRLSVWPYPITVLWVVGVGYFMAFFDITNIAFGLPIFSKLFHMTVSQQAYPISASLFGYILGAWLNSNLADFAGRKRGIALATALFSIGCLGSTFAGGLATMVFWRFVTGMGVGAEIAIITTYIGEISPAGIRGRYTGWANVFSFLGLAVVPVVALWLVPNFTWGWRAMFLIGAFGILTLPLFYLLPESPRWLMTRRRIAEAKAVVEAAERRALARLGSLPSPAPASCEEVGVHGFPTAQLFRQPYFSRLVLLLAIWFIWYVGEYIWLGLGPTYFVDRGFTLTHSIMFMLMSSIALPVGALLAAWLGDVFERKFSIVAGMLVWVAAFAVIAFTVDPAVIYACVFLVAGALGFVIPLMFTLTAESFPTRARSTGVSLSDGLGHLGGAVGPVLATNVYAAGGAAGFTWVFLLIAGTGLLAVCILPFSVAATRRMLETVAT